MEYTAAYMKQWVADNGHLVRVRELPDNLYLLKYKNKVFYDRLWAPELLECRGTIVDEDFNIVSRPPTKVFNWGETNNSYIDPMESVRYTKKINGFMAQATVHKGKLLVGTTGTTDSKYAAIAKKHLYPYADLILKYFGSGITLTFEIVDESDPHIIKETPGVYFLLARENRWDAPRTLGSINVMKGIAEDLGMMFPWTGLVPMQNILEWRTFSNVEGYMVYGKNKTLKVKTNSYLVTKFLARMKLTKLEKRLTNPEQLKQKVDEEYYDLVDYLALHRSFFMQCNEQQRILLIRDFLTTKN